MHRKELSNTIEDLKRSVSAMLVERSQRDSMQGTLRPSPMWADLTNVSSYLMNLSAEDFRNIRFHTGIIDGTSLRYWYPNPPPDPEREAKKLGYIDAIQGVPERYWVGEPPTPGIPRPLGVDYRGRIVNKNTARFQRCISNLYHIGVLDSLLKAKRKQLIVEIGGGYGGLAHHLVEILAEKVTYLIIDLPELFLFQGAYLGVNHPEKSVYLYDPRTFTSDFLHGEMYDYDFVLVPNYALNELDPVDQIALMINMDSFQEMTERQVREYLEFGAERIGLYLYSDNVDVHPHNEDLSPLTGIFESYFSLYPSPAYYDNKFRGTEHRWTQYSRKFFAIPKGSGRSFPQQCRDPNILVQTPMGTTPLLQRWARKFIPRKVRQAILRLALPQIF